MKNKLIVKPSIILLYVVLIVAFKCYYLIPLPGTLGTPVNDILTSSMAILSFITVILTDRSILNKAKLKNFFIIFYFFIFFEIIYSSIKYPHESIFEFFKEASPYIVLLSYFVFLKFIKFDNDKVINFVITSATFIAVVFILQAVSYNANGTIFLKIYGFQYGKIRFDLRNGNIRLLASDLVAFSSFLSMGKIFESKRIKSAKFKYWINIATVIIYELYASQTRSMSMIIIISLVCVILKYCANKKGYKVLMLLLAFLVFFVLSSSIYGYFREIVLSAINRSDYSLYHRVDAIKYYLETAFKHPLTGIGLLRDDTSVVAYSIIIHGNGPSAYGYNDVGLAGVIGKFGLVGGIIYLYPIVWQIKQYRRTQSPMAFSILLAFVLSIPNFSLFDSGRLIVLSLFLAISESRGIEEPKIINDAQIS